MVKKTVKENEDEKVVADESPKVSGGELSVEYLTGQPAPSTNSNLNPSEPKTVEPDPASPPVLQSAPPISYSQNGDVPTQEVSGILEITPEGYGYLRPKFTPSENDVYISQSQIRRFQLRPGDHVAGLGRPPKENERYFGILKVVSINSQDADKIVKRVSFSQLTPLYPDKQIVLETGKIPISTRIIDLIAPIGRGQRGLIVSPPKAGKTTILKDIANGISENFKDIHLMATLIGERPEEVTDIARSVKGEVISSNFDEPAEDQSFCPLQSDFGYFSLVFCRLVNV